MWRAASVVLVLAAVITVGEGSVAPDGRVTGALATGIFPALGALVAWQFGPRLRPRASFVVGRVFLNLSIVTVAQSVFTWRDTAVGSAMAFHYVVAIVFAAVYFDRREVYEALALTGVLHGIVLFYDGYTAAELLMWTLTMLGVASSGLVIHAVVRRMHHLSYRDGLTGASNRRAWDLGLANAVDEHSRAGQPLSLLLIDIDHFKAINDTDGHEAGDRVLCAAIAVWSDLVRASDVLARLGGDEFALLLRQCDTEAALHLAELLRTSLQRETGASCSVGAVTMRSRTGAADLLAAADAQLYEAKTAGRGCVRSTVIGGDGTRTPQPA
jgi:diguanylate cyclase (GGDEF)-like protein